MVLARRSQICSSSAQGHRCGWRLCEKIEHGFKAIFIVVCNFQGSGIYTYGKKMRGINFRESLAQISNVGKINFSCLLIMVAVLR
jgi:hypothetical protein